jgi:hypothetical protein
MKKTISHTILKFGLISGILSSLMMLATMPFLHKLGGDMGYVLGYTAIVLSFLLVYFGIRSYRDNTGDGLITFPKAFGIGISITLISCVFYVVTWEIVYFNFMHDSMDTYSTQMVEKMKASGASASAIQAQVQQMKRYKEDPLYKAAFTFIEPFPVGLVITLISAGILRKRTPTQPAASLQPASE